MPSVKSWIRAKGLKIVIGGDPEVILRLKARG
jgi:hypothetical protein